VRDRTGALVRRLGDHVVGVRASSSESLADVELRFDDLDVVAPPPPSTK
jgi:hypothetical protein